MGVEFWMFHKIKFLGWEKPLIESAVEYLTATYTSGALDLNETLIIVPTAHSGRRLREKLAVYAAEKGTVVFPGLVTTPNFLVTGDQHNQRVIKNVQSMALWTHLLLSVDVNEYSSLFPAPPSTPNFEWAFGVARQLTKLRKTLADYGYLFSDVLTKVGSSFEERERWQDLEKLEQRYLLQLKTMNLVDRVMAVKAAITNPLSSL